ncbi:MAG: LptF/LptG family permease [Flavobacteriales bacterium]|nr:LptF/LptG family permease [Flavobacteriales bacterium]
MSRASDSLGTLYLESLTLNQKKRLFSSTIDLSSAGQRNVSNVKTDIDAREKLRDKHLIEWHRKFFLAFSCVMLFFIGAPLGAIIRKGGMGWPTVWAIGLFLIYYVFSIIGERMVKSNVLEPWQGMWVSTVILFPMSCFLTYKAAKDSPLFESETYKRFFVKLFKKNKDENSTAVQ